MSEIWVNIQTRAKELGMNISDIAYAARISMPTARRYWYGTKDGKETGPPLTQVDLVILRKIAKVLGVRTHDLIGEEDRLALNLAPA